MRPPTCCLALLAAVAAAPPCAHAQAAADARPAVDSPIRADEEVVLFPTLASRAPDGGGWLLDVHGWIYEPEEDSPWRDLVVQLSAAFPALQREDLDNPLLQRRLRAFLVDNERGKRLPLSVAGSVERLPASAPNGHFTATLTLGDEALAAALGDDGWLPLEVLTPARDARRFTGRALPIGQEGLSVVSDIDDTVKLSHVTDRERLVRTTFLEEWQAVPGMAALYDRLAARGAVFHYVSSSPWQLGPELVAFLAAAGLPAGSFHLKTFRVKDETLLDLFASPEETKPAVLRPLLARFPERRFVLVGDSGEKDPEVYGIVARGHPAQVVRILIRAVEGGDNAPERFAAAFADVPAERWQVFTDPAEVELP